MCCPKPKQEFQFRVICADKRQISSSHILHIMLSLPTPRIRWDSSFFTITTHLFLLFSPCCSLDLRYWSAGAQSPLVPLNTNCHFHPSQAQRFVLTAVGFLLVGFSMETTTSGFLILLVSKALAAASDLVPPTQVRCLLPVPSQRC